MNSEGSGKPGEGFPGDMTMGLSKVIVKRVVLFSALFGTLLISVILYSVIAQRPAAFLTTSSPEKTYTVYLTGQKERPLFFTVEVHFNVLKNGRPFLSNKFLHSGDSEDISFESGYPNQRWINENTIQFYREEYFNGGKPDTLVVVNNTDETIKYAKIESVDKVLLVDLQPGFKVKMVTPRPRGDSKWFNVAGEFSDGRTIVGTNTNMSVPNQQALADSNTYYVSINADRVTLEVRK